MKTSDVKESSCPQCGTKFNQATHLSKDVQPKPGDMSLCINCGTILKFKNNLTVRLATLEEMLQLANENRAAFNELSRMQAAIVVLKQSKS